MRLKGNSLLSFVPNFTVIDLETTGRGMRHTDITELSGIKYRNYRPVASFSTLIKADFPILPFVVKLTGISDEMIADAPSISDKIGEFVSFIGDDIIVGHNVNFDLNLVYDAYHAVEGKSLTNNYFDTLRASRVLNKDSENHKLETLCLYFGIKRVIGHRGYEDCEQTGELYIKMMNKAKLLQVLDVQEVQEMNVYDFDKTIYDGDSSIDFYKYNLKKNIRLIKHWPKQIKAALLYKLKKITKTEMKTIFYEYFGEISNIEKEITLFWESHSKKIKPWYLEQKDKNDVIVSASPEFFLRPICEQLGVHLIASDVDPITGQNRRENCYGDEKVVRFKEYFDLKEIEGFYSDSYSDDPLARYAKAAFIVKGNELLEW